MNLVEALALRLNDVVPDDVEVRAVERGVGAFEAGSDYGSVTLLDPADFGGDVARWAERIAENAQDFVIEFSVKGGWPPADPSDPTARQHAAELPSPAAEVRDDELHVWFGDRDSPALSLAPILLGDPW